MQLPTLRVALTVLSLCVLASASGGERGPARAVRVFIFAGQSNMVGSHSRADDVDDFAPFRGLGEPQAAVSFHYCLGREDRRQSDGWVEMQPVNGVLGPEVSFSRRLDAELDDSIAVIKVATGGTTLGEDWNPDEPGGLKLYPRMIERVGEALEALDKGRHKYRVEGVFWHQGENDMFVDEYRANYAANLGRLIECWRRDLALPELPFFIGGHCTKTVWGMDHRHPMYAIDRAQHEVTDADPLAHFVPNSHVGVELGGETGLHYHYGTLGQLEHGEAYAEAYLRESDAPLDFSRPLKRWPYPDGSKVTLYVAAGHRGMEGEGAYAGALKSVRGGKKLAKGDPSTAFRYSLGGGFRVSPDWEPMGPAGWNGAFGPELSFAAGVGRKGQGGVAIAKFTHSGSQLIDWQHDADDAAARHVFPGFIAFIKDSVASLEAKGHQVELGGILYHFSENDTAYFPYRKVAAERLGSFVQATRSSLDAPELRWFVSQSAPASHKGVDSIDVVGQVAALAKADPLLFHVKVDQLPGENHPLRLSAEGTVALGQELAKAVLAARK